MRSERGHGFHNWFPCLFILVETDHAPIKMRIAAALGRRDAFTVWDIEAWEMHSFFFLRS